MYLTKYIIKTQNFKDDLKTKTQQRGQNSDSNEDTVSSGIQIMLDNKTALGAFSGIKPSLGLGS